MRYTNTALTKSTMGMPMKKASALLIGAAILAGCATAPTGPSVMALPGSNKSFDQFRLDDMDCRNYAVTQSNGTTANDAAREMGLGTAVITTAVGALAGAAANGHKGAGVGAAVGLIGGGLAGVERGDTAANNAQRRYDNAYVQCMYAKGQQVPVPANLTTRRNSEGMVEQPGRGAAIPPPPPK